MSKELMNTSIIPRPHLVLSQESIFCKTLISVLTTYFFFTQSFVGPHLAFQSICCCHYFRNLGNPVRADSTFFVSTNLYKLYFQCRFFIKWIRCLLIFLIQWMVDTTNMRLIWYIWCSISLLTTSFYFRGKFSSHSFSQTRLSTK